MAVEIEKIPGGFKIDGLSLIGMKCGCATPLKCCYTWSKVKKKGGNRFEFKAKATTPETVDNFTWGYEVKKDGTTIHVEVEDARDKDIFSGFFPPSVNAWVERGWEIIEKHGDREDGVLWRCAMCKWLYKEDKEGRPFEELPKDWVCPVCGASKDNFEMIG